MAEFALVLPPFIFLFMGIFEFGMIFRQDTTFSGAVQTAARTGSHSGNNPTADQLTLTNLKASMDSMRNTVLTKVIVYKGVAADGLPPAACQAVVPNGSGAGVSGSCNVYSPTQVNTATTGSWGDAAGCSGTDWDQYWCPKTRKNTLISVPDHFGVHVTAQYTYITQLLPGTGRTITDHAVYRVEVTD